MRTFIKFIFLIMGMAIISLDGHAQRIQRCDNGLYGLAVTKSDGNIKWLASPKYVKIEKNYNGSFSVCDKSNRWGVITLAGTTVLECKYATMKEAVEAYKSYLHPELKNNASNTSSSTPYSGSYYSKSSYTGSSYTGYSYSSSPNEYTGFTLTRDYSSYIKKYVEDEINVWQKKGEFEKTSDYRKRVTESTRKAKVAQLTKEVCDECLAGVKDKELQMSIGEYDADNESFLIDTEIGKFVLPVPIDRAQTFKKNWAKVTSTNTYDIVNGKIILRSAVFKLNGKKVATYSDQNRTLYAQANIQYNFDPIEVPLQDEKTINSPQIVQNNIQIGKSDVDMNIPTTSYDNSLTFALIISNENYRDETNVNYANNDGNTVKQYFAGTLGIPEKNIHYAQDATKNDMIREIDWLKNVASVYDEDINIIVYYAGHGVPNEADGSAFLIPVDGVGTNPKTLMALTEFYDELSSIKSKSTVLFMDACFSGAVRGHGMLASARGIALKAKQEMPKSNMVVISAATGDETAWPYEEKRHGLFTYFLLKKLQMSKGNVTLGQLSEYIKTEVGKQSVVSNSKRQTPTVNVSHNLADSWHTIKLK